MFLYYIGGQAARGRRQIRRVQGKHALPLFYTDVLSMCAFYTSVDCIQYPEWNLNNLATMGYIYVPSP